MRLASWNVNSLRARLPRVEQWLKEHQPDVLCMQETKLAEDAFPTESFASWGYESLHCGEGRWNGVAIVSRVGLEDPRCGFSPTGERLAGEARIASATCAGLRVASVYVPNGRTLEDPHYQYKLEWLARLVDHLGAEGDPATPMIVAGDFNIAPEDRDVWDPADFVGSTHVSQLERDALAVLHGWGMDDLFRMHDPHDVNFTYWDYRAGNFHKNKGMRIDLLLGTKPVAEVCTDAWVDRQARKGQLPSDHAPVVVELDWSR